MSSADFADAPSEPALFAARLRPHRSLRPEYARLLLIGFLGVNVVTSLPFILLGAWPVAGFCGLDVALLYVAFRASARAADAYEDFAVTPFELRVAKVSPRGERAEWRFNPAFVRLEREEHEEFGTLKLELISRGRRLEVAAFLGPGEKADFAGALSRALAEAKRGLRYS